MPRALPFHVQQLRDYLLQPSERNEDLALSYFRKVFGEKFKRQSDAANSDGYVAGHFVLEIKGDTKDWFAGLLQGLAYERRNLAFTMIVVCAKRFLAIWQKSDLPDDVRNDVLLNAAAPNTLGRRYAAKHARKRNAILRKAIWHRPELSGDLFFQTDQAFADLVASFEDTLSQCRKVRQPITPRNFVGKLKEMKTFFDKSTPIKTVRAFYSMLYGPWDVASVVSLNQRHDDRAVLGAAEITDLVPAKRLAFKEFVENHLVHTTAEENVDDFFARYDEALDAIDKTFRIRHGIFFTDLNLSKLAIWLAKQHLPNLGKNYLVIDPACGSGNLVTNWRSPLELRHKVVSEIEPELLYAVEQRMKGDQWHNGKFTVVPKVSENVGLNFLDKSATDYLEILGRYLAEKGQRPDRPIAFLCNPPYRSDDDQSAAAINYRVHPSIVDLIGADAASERYCCFLAQMKLICRQAKECGLPDGSILLLFTETSWLTNRPIFRQVRAELLKSFQNLDGVLIDSKQFFDVKGSFPIAFTMWAYKGEHAQLNPERPIVLKDLTWLTRKQVASLPWHDEELLDDDCAKLLADKRSIRVPLGIAHQRISDWCGQKMTDFKRARRKDEVLGQHSGGLPLGDPRVANKKAYGEKDGRVIGFMDDLTPCRTKKGLNGVPWFRLNPQFMDAEKTRMFSGPPTHFGYCARTLDEARKVFVWYSLARTFRHTGYPLWAHNSELWPVATTTKKEELVFAYCLAIAYAENECVQITVPARNPSSDSIEVFVENPMTKLDPSSFWMRALSPYLQSLGALGVVRPLIQAVDRVFDAWSGQLGRRSELPAEFEKPYLIGTTRLGVGSGLLQLRDYASAHTGVSLEAALLELDDKLRKCKSKFYEFLVSDLQYFSSVSTDAHPRTEVFVPRTRFDHVLEKRLAIAGLLVDNSKDDANFGRTKLAKLFYLVDMRIPGELRTEYSREAAGPLDHRALYNAKVGLEALANKHRYFAAVPSETFVRYQRLENLGNLLTRAKQILSHAELSELDRICSLFAPLKTEQAEIIATLFACWNDILLDRHKRVTDEMIIREFLTHWHPSKARFARSRLERALKWMRESALTPTGTGHRTLTAIKQLETETA